MAQLSPRASAATTGSLKVFSSLPRSHVTTSVGRVAQLPAEISIKSSHDFDEEDVDDDDDDDDGDDDGDDDDNDGGDDNNDSGGREESSTPTKQTSAKSPPGSVKKQTYDISDMDATVTRITWSTGAYADVGEDSGALLEWVDGSGKPLISHTQPLELCLYRALVDNDRGGGPLSYNERWQAAGYHDLIPIGAPQSRHSIKSVNFIPPPDGKGDEKALCIEADWTVISKTNPTTRIPATCRYLFFPSGAVEVKFHVQPSMTLPILPRVGIRFASPIGINQDIRTTWLGLGPHESYPDRTECCSLGVYQGSLDDMHTPYVVPGENGLRMDPRYFSLCDAYGSGLLVIPNTNHGVSAGSVRGYGFSVSRYGLEQLDRSSHEHLLRSAHNSVYVHVDCAHMGVGGYDSWSPNVDYEYQISPALPPHGDGNGRANPRSRDSQVEGSVLLSPTHSSNLYSEFCRYGLW